MYVPHDEAIDKMKLAMAKEVLTGGLVKVEYDVCQSVLGLIDELKSEVKQLHQEIENLEGEEC